MAMTRDEISDLEADILRDAQRAARDMVKANKERAARDREASESIIRRPEVAEEIAELEAQVSETVKKNINAIMDVEKLYEDGMTRHQLSSRMGWASNIIYTQLGENSRSNIGMRQICRYSKALSIPVHVLVTPHATFRKTFLSEYKAKRDSAR